MLYLYNIRDLKIEIEFNSTIKYTLSGGFNINFVLFASLESDIVIIIFSIVIHSNPKMRNVFIVVQQWDMISNQISPFTKFQEIQIGRCHYKYILIGF